jgi:hypothetical protein
MWIIVSVPTIVKKPHRWSWYEYPTRLTKIINNKNQNLCEKIYGWGKEEWCEIFFTQTTPFYTQFAAFKLAQHYWLPPMWPITCCHVATTFSCIEGWIFSLPTGSLPIKQRPYYSLCRRRTVVRLFFSIYTLTAYIARGVFWESQGVREWLESAKRSTQSRVPYKVRILILPKPNLIRPTYTSNN